MAVAGCPAVDGSSEIQFLKDVGDIEIQDFAREITDDGIRLFLRPECVERDRNRLGSSDDVGDLDLTAACELGGNDIFCQEAAGVSSGTVHFGRIFAAETASAVASHASVGIDDDLPSRDSGVGCRSADLPAPCAVHN